MQNKYLTLQQIRELNKLEYYSPKIKRTILLLAGIIILSSFIIPVIFPAPLGIALSKSLIARYG